MPFLQRFLKAEETKPKAETPKEEKPQKDGKKEEAEKPAQKASLHGFPVDSIVITIASKNKDKYHDQKAKVLAELTSHVKVQLLSGPAIAETRKYDPKCLKLADDGVTQPDNEKLRRMTFLRLLQNEQLPCLQTLTCRGCSSLEAVPLLRVGDGKVLVSSPSHLKLTSRFDLASPLLPKHPSTFIPKAKPGGHTLNP